MFKFVAAIFLLTNGVPSDDPATVMTYNQKTFQTEASCLEFPKTDEGKAAMARLDVGDKPLIVRFGCIEAEDNSI